MRLSITALLLAAATAPVSILFYCFVVVLLRPRRTSTDWMCGMGGWDGNLISFARPVRSIDGDGDVGMEWNRTERSEAEQKFYKDH